MLGQNPSGFGISFTIHASCGSSVLTVCLLGGLTHAVTGLLNQSFSARGEQCLGLLERDNKVVNAKCAFCSNGCHINCKVCQERAVYGCSLSVFPAQMLHRIESLLSRLGQWLERPWLFWEAQSCWLQGLLSDCIPSKTIKIRFRTARMSFLEEINKATVTG